MSSVMSITDEPRIVSYLPRGPLCHNYGGPSFTSNQIFLTGGTNPGHNMSQCAPTQRGWER